MRALVHGLRTHSIIEGITDTKPAGAIELNAIV